MTAEATSSTGRAKSKAKTKGRDGRAARSAPRGQTQKGKARKPGKLEYSLKREILYITFGCLGILIGLVVIVASAGFWYGSGMIVGILEEIGRRDFSGPMERVSHYEVFFESLPGETYGVVRDKPTIRSGVTSYLWRVQLRGSGELRIFSWQHDLNTNTVESLTNSALLLDIELGYETDEKARLHDFYDPDDKLAQAIVKSEFSLIGATDLAEPWVDGSPPSGPVGVPAISPEEAQQRQAEAKKKDEEENKTEEAGTGSDDSEGTEAVEVGVQAGDDSSGDGSSSEDSAE